MNASAAIADPLLLRVNRERDKQDVRDSKIWVLGSEFEVPKTSNFGPRTVTNNAG